MADVFSAVILNNDYWDGTTSWAGEVDEAARDAKYGARRYTSLQAWETARDGVAQAADDEYANIFGPWASHDAAEVTIQTWTNKPNLTTIQTIGTDARSQDGKFDSNNCYVLENDGATHAFDINEAGHTITIEGIQIEASNTGSDNLIRNDNAATLIISKCFLIDTGDQGSYGIQCNGGTTLIVNTIILEMNRAINFATAAVVGVYNCTIRGHTIGISDVAGTSTSTNNALCDNTNDHLAVDTIESCATDEGAGEGTNGDDVSATWNTTCFTDETTGDYSIEVDSPLKDASDTSQADDGDVPSDDIIGIARNTGAGQTVSIGAYAYVAAGGLSIPIVIHHRRHG